MTLQLPGWLIPAFDYLDLPWPGIDEDQLRAWAQSVRTFARDMADNSAGTHRTVARLADSSQSSFTTALTARWEQQSRVVAGLQGHLNDFANALDGMAEAVSTQKQAVISAVTMLADQLNDNQVKPGLTVGLPPVGAGGTAESEQISLAREVVQSALEYLESELSGNLINTAVAQVSEQISASLAGLRNGAVPVARETRRLKLSYKSLDHAAHTIRGNATETENIGTRAYNENADRTLMGSSLGSAGDGGHWHAVVQAVEQALQHVAGILFKPLSEAISDCQRNTAGAVSSFASEVKRADDSRSRGATDRRASVAQHEARLTGAAAANQFLDGVISEKEFFKLFREHEHDPAWQTAAVGVLSVAVFQWDDVHITGKADERVLARAIITAMAHGFAPGQGWQWLIEDQQMLAPLLKSANLPPRELFTLGKEAMQVDAPPTFVRAVWSTLAANPELAAQFVRQNAPQIVNFLSSSPFSYMDYPRSSLLAMLKAGTIGAGGTHTHPRGGAAAVQALVTACDKDPGAHVSSQFEALYGQIVKSYWQDLQVELTNKTGVGGKLPTPDGIRLSLRDWSPFIDEAMRDPKTAESLLKFWYAKALLQEENAPEVNSSDPYADDLYIYNTRYIAMFFSNRAEAAYEQIASDDATANAWKQDVIGFLNNYVIATGADPGAAATALGIKGAQLTLDPIARWLLNLISPDKNPPASPQKLPDSYAYWAQVAFQTYYETHSAADPRPDWVASAKLFVKEGPPPYIPDPKNMGPSALAAFNKWLDTPAVYEQVLAAEESGTFAGQQAP